MDFNKTVNLPKTDFPMRAGLPKREPDMLKHWEELDLYNELLKENEGKLHELADYLYQHETITGKEFMEILERKSLPEETKQ